MTDQKLNRRDFVKSAASAGATLTVLRSVKGKVLGANNQIHIGIIGVGGRGRDLLNWVMKTGEQPNTPAKVLAVSDVYGKRLRQAKEKANCEGFLDYSEIIKPNTISPLNTNPHSHFHSPLSTT